MVFPEPLLSTTSVYSRVESVYIFERPPGEICYVTGNGPNRALVGVCMWLGSGGVTTPVGWTAPRGDCALHSCSGGNAFIPPKRDHLPLRGAIYKY